jgi:hypothetical protein
MLGKVHGGRARVKPPPAGTQGEPFATIRGNEDRNNALIKSPRSPYQAAFLNLYVAMKRSVKR